MLMVVFGAGASHDSRGDLPVGGSCPPEADRPPLASNLFDTRFRSVAARFKITAATLNRLTDHGKPLEDNLRELNQEAETNHGSAQQITAIRWYLQVVVAQCGEIWSRRSGPLNHELLINKIEQWTARRNEPDQAVCFVTFNYDELIERSLERAPTRPICFDSNDAYTQHSNYKLFKLHGSVIWSREIVEPRFEVQGRSQLEIAHDVIERAPLQGQFSDCYNLWSYGAPTADNPIASNAPMENAMIPAIAIPITEKEPKFVCPPEHVPRLEECLPRVTKVLVIGSQGKEAHFFRLFPAHTDRRPIGLVVSAGRRDAQKVAERLKSIGDFESSASNFSAFVSGDELEWFLAR